MEHLEEGRGQLPESEGGWEDEPGSGPGESTQEVKGQSCPKRLFSLNAVNSYGTADINALDTEEELLKLNCKRFL